MSHLHSHVTRAASLVASVGRLAVAMTACTELAVAGPAAVSLRPGALAVDGQHWQWKGNALVGRSPRYQEVPEAAADGFGTNGYAYFQARAVDLWTYALFGDPTGRDYRVSATLRIESPAPLQGVRPGQGCIFMNYQWGREAMGSDAGIVVRHRGQDSYYQVRLSSAYGHVELWKTHGGVVQVRPYKLEVDKEYRVEVTVSGCWITVAVDGQEVIRYADAVEPLECGRAGLAVRESRVRFTDVTLTPVPRDSTPAPAHKPDFHIRAWVGRDTLFDGDEPVGHLPPDRMVFEELKLKPGLMPLVIAQTTPSVWGVGYDQVRWGERGAMEVQAEGETLRLAVTPAETSGVVRVTGQWVLSYDPKEQSYVLDGRVAADVLKSDVLTKWGSVNLTDPMFYQLLDPAAGPLPSCRRSDNAAIFVRDDGTTCAFPLNHEGKNNAFAPAHGLAIKPGGYWATVVDGWGVVTEIPEDNTVRFYGDYCAWGLDQHIAPLWKPDQVSYAGPTLKEAPAKAGDRFEGHVRFRLMERRDAEAALARAVRPLSGANAGPDQWRLVHREPVNACDQALPLVNGSSALLWMGRYEWVRDAGHGDRDCLRLRGGDAMQLPSIGPSFRAGPYRAARYRVGAWVRSRDFQGTVRCAFDNAVYPDSRKATLPSAELALAGPGDWQWLGFETDIPHLTCFWSWSFTAKGQGEIEVDDITLAPVDGQGAH